MRKLMKICKQCGKVFKARNKKHKYCSKKCLHKARNKKLK